MTATDTTPAAKKMTEKERFTLFVLANDECAALLGTAETTRDGTAYGVLADWLEERGEYQWAVTFRTCCRGDEYAMALDGSTYHTFPAMGYKGKTVYDVCRMSPKMRNRFGQSEYVYSAAELVSYMTARRQQADAKADRKAKEKAAKATARHQPNPYKVGDLLHYSYGYDRTINHFAQVVSVTGQTVTYRRVRVESVEVLGMTTERIRPVRDDLYGEPETARLAYSAWGDKASASLPVAGHKGKHWHKIGDGETFYETDNH